MKTSIAFMLIFLASCSSISRSTFVIQEKKYKYSKDSEEFKEQIKSLANLSDESVHYSKVEKLTGTDSGTNQKYQYIQLTDENKNLVSAILIKSSNEKSKVYFLEQRIVTCKSATGCSPELFNSNWSCVSKQDSIDCLKTVTVFD